MPAFGLHAIDVGGRCPRPLALALVAVLLASLAVGWSSPTQARDWTPQIKVARSSQVYWEGMMRRADAEVRALRKAKRKTKTYLKRARAQLEVRVERRRTAKRTLSAARAELRETQAERAAIRAEMADRLLRTFAPPDIVVAASVLWPAGLSVHAPPLLRAVDETPVAAPVATEATILHLQKRVQKHKRQYQRTVRKAKRSAQAVRATRSRLSSLKRQQRSAVARRESAERNLGSWILTMERYARGRAGNMSKYRPGIDSRFAWPARGRISQGYSRSHDGLDIAGYQGTPVRAAAFGVVAYVGWNPWDERGRAFMVVLAHRGGLETLYGHILPRRSVTIGQAVRQGEVIGYMGNTGKSTGTHLHFEVRRGRTTVNPRGYL